MWSLCVHTILLPSVQTACLGQTERVPLSVDLRGKNTPRRRTEETVDNLTFALSLLTRKVRNQLLHPSLEQRWGWG